MRRRLYLDGARDLIGVQNCVHDPGRLVRLRLSAQFRRTSGAFDPGRVLMLDLD